MIQPIARFRFNGYRITKSIIDVKDIDQISNELSIDISAKGRHYVDDLKFELQMNINVQDANKGFVVSVIMEALFEFDKECKTDELENFFYKNAPAIVFPYLRAYISSLTALGCAIKPVILPTLNLSDLHKELKENTTTVPKSEVN